MRVILNLSAALFSGLFSLNVYAQCVVVDSKGSPVTGLDDALFETLDALKTCPADVFELKTTLQTDGLHVAPAMVANRGRHNPGLGSFSFFEIVSGHSSTLQRTIEADEFYFGHFTHTQSGKVELDQIPGPGKLMIELIAWDPSKEVYNFYELIGKRSGSTWFYRGDSLDAIKDNQLLHRQSNPNAPQFGQRMRCSGCHTSGGPIMKELESPHNDWWTEARPLTLGRNAASNIVASWLGNTIDASQFADSVRSGIAKLENSQAMKDFKKTLSLQEQLRPLFCTTEINLVSDRLPLQDSSQVIHVPADYFANPLLVQSLPLQLRKTDYEQVLGDLDFRFPETNRRDADHAWLAPVKGHSDLWAIKSLMQQNTADEEFIVDVLAVDFTNPLFSAGRCALLKLVPDVFSPSWKTQFQANLQNSSEPAAVQLFENLANSTRNIAFHKKQAELYITKTQADFQDSGKVRSAMIDLQQRRTSVFQNEISKNPRGQILEPGFRVIFPAMN